MTMISRLGFKPTKINNIKSELLKSTSEITIVIPVKNNQNGIELFLEQFFKTHKSENYPKEIIIVDNNSKPSLKIETKIYPISIKIFSCSKIGPASARNFGVENVKSEWILFTDSDCIPTENLLTGYLQNQNYSIGYAGNIISESQDLISKYYDDQEILIPPEVYQNGKKSRPDYLVTANCLVWKKAFEIVGGFNEEIKIAGGEDIDLGFKLLNIGELSYAFESVSKHNFGGGISDFKNRFIRYGFGNKIISEIYNLDLEPKLFKPNKKTIVNYLLAYLQYKWLRKGYKMKENNRKKTTANSALAQFEF